MINTIVTAFMYMVVSTKELFKRNEYIEIVSGKVDDDFVMNSLYRRGLHTIHQGAFTEFEKDSIILTATVDGEEKGFITFKRRAKDHVNIYELYSERKGLGTKLLDVLKDRYPKDIITLTSNDECFWIKQGFKPSKAYLTNTFTFKGE